MSEIERLLPERTSIADITSLDEAEKRAFYLYRETAIIVLILGSIYEDVRAQEYPLDRNMAILSGLVIRTGKFMKAIAQLAAERSSGEIIGALNRCVLESAVNLEYLVSSKKIDIFDEYVESGLGPERELYDTIMENVESRGGKRLPIEDRMIASIERVAKPSGKSIAQIERKRREWGTNLRERLRTLDKQDLYLTIQRMGSHAIHGTWVDLMQNHLRTDGMKFCIRATKRPDARILTPTAYLVLDSMAAYVDLLWNEADDEHPLRARIRDLSERVLAFEAIHEGLFSDSRVPHP